MDRDRHTSDAEKPPEPIVAIGGRLNDDVRAGIIELDAGKSIDACEVYADARRRIQAIDNNRAR